MKPIALTAALVAALSAPAAFASDSLAASIGVAPGQYTTAELIQLRTALEDNDTAQVRFLMNGGAPGPVDGSIAYQARIRQAIEDQDSAELRYLLNTGSEVISTQSFGQNDRAAAIFARLFEESREDEN